MATVHPGSPDWIRPLGDTGLEVSAVCLGTSPLGSMPRLYGRHVSQDEGVATVRAVLESPIRFLDTSNGYSDGESERRIGEAIALHGGLPADFLVGTKVDARGRDYSGARVRASVAESRERLGMDYLPLVHLHDPEYFEFEEITEPGGALDALVELKRSGEVGAIGLAGGEVHEMSRYLALGAFDVLLTHNRWTLVDRSATALLAQAASLGVAVLNAAVYGGGILATIDRSTTYGYREAPRAMHRTITSMRRVCEAYGADLATASLQFSVRDPRFASTVVGMSRPERVASTLDAVAAALPDDLWDELDALVPPEHTWLDAPFDR